MTTGKDANTNLEIHHDVESADQVREPMEETELETTLGRLIRDAVNYSDSTLGPYRKEVLNYYKGRPFGNEEEGRSQVVLTVVRDTVESMMPSIMRTFFGPERIVEYGPRFPEDVAGAEQATDFVEHIITGDNKGYLELQAAFTDAALYRRGIVKYFWDDAVRTERYEANNLTEEQLILLEGDPNVEFEVIDKHEYTDPRALAAFSQAQEQWDALNPKERGAAVQQGAQPPIAPEPVMLHHIAMSRINEEGRAVIMAVPPEEFIYTSDGRSIEDAVAVIHRRDLTRSELRAQGVPEELIEEVFGASSTGHSSFNTELKSNEEAIARQPAESLTPSDVHDDSMRDVPFYEVYAYVDIGGDGIAEHIKARLVGHNPRYLDHELAPERPFAVFEGRPLPHTFEGASVADSTMDLQLTQSSLLRGVLDSLSFALHPRTEIVEGQVNIGDVKNTEIGALIRTRAPGMIRELPHAFQGQQAIPWFQALDEIKETRTGISKAAAGLDPDSLQSSTKAAVAATISGAQQHLDHFVRNLAETGMKQLMRGLLRMVIRNQQYSRVVRLRNKFENVDPRLWDANMDVVITVAPGMTLADQRIAHLERIAMRQESVIAQMGPNNPLVTLGQYSHTLSRIAELGGVRDTARFWNELPANFQLPPPPDEPSPEEILANAQVAKVQADTAIAQARLQLDEAEFRAKEERERQRIEADIFLRAKEMELKHGSKIHADELRAGIERSRQEVKSDA